MLLTESFQIILLSCIHLILLSIEKQATSQLRYKLLFDDLQPPLSFPTYKSSDFAFRSLFQTKISENFDEYYILSQQQAYLHD